MIVVSPCMAPKDDNEPISLDRERTGKFLHAIADDPFLAIVVTEEGEVRIFAKDIESDHLERIREVLVEIRDG